VVIPRDDGCYGKLAKDVTQSFAILCRWQEGKKIG